MRAAVRWLTASAARVPWRVVLLASYVGVNLVFIPTKVRLDPAIPVDWQTFSALPAAIADGTIYDLEGAAPFTWSPVAAWIMAGVTMVGYWPWVVAHVAMVLLLRDVRMIGLVLVSYGFWWDTAQGNTLTFALVAGMLALTGSRAAALGYFAVFVLIPRPLMAPLALWLLWRDRSLLRPLAAMAVLHATIVVISGYGLIWPAAVLRYELPTGITIGPTALVGHWWLLIGIPLGLWLAWRGTVGWAGLAVSPWVAPQYVLWPLLDLVPKAGNAALGHESDSAESALPSARPQETD